MSHIGSMPFKLTRNVDRSSYDFSHTLVGRAKPGNQFQ